MIEVIRTSNSEVGGRVVEWSGKEYAVRGRGYIRSLEDIRALPVGSDRKGTPIHVEDCRQGRVAARRCAAASPS